MVAIGFDVCYNNNDKNNKTLIYERYICVIQCLELVLSCLRKEGQSMENTNYFYDVKQMIEYACLMSGTSKTQLAKKMGMAQSTFEYRLKTGKFSIEEWQKIEQALNVHICLQFNQNQPPLAVAVPVLVNEE